MIGVNFVPDMCAIHVHVDFRSGDTFVTQHQLYRPEICTLFQQMRGKRVPEGVR